MADIKNFGIKGVGDDVQFGKQGSRIRVDIADDFEAVDNAGQYVNVKAADPIHDQDLVTKSFLDSSQASLDGMDIILGIPDDADLDDGAVTLTQSTTVTNAIDELNEILGLLVPEQPPTWPNSNNISVSGDATWQIASGAVTDNTTDGLPTAGSNVNTIFSAGFSSNTVGDAGDNGEGPGTEGTVTALLNGASIGAITLDTTDNAGVNGDLNISSNADFPAATPGFWRIVRAQIQTATASAGYNKIQITHSAASNTNEYYFVYDDQQPSAGSTSGLSIADPGLTTTNSSNIPHFDNGQSLDVSGTINGVSGLTYRQDDAVTIQGTNDTGNGSIANQVSYDFGDTGMPSNPPAINTASDTFSSLDLSLANVHARGNVQVRFRNTNGGSFSTISSPEILVMGSATTSAIDEDNIDTSGVPNISGGNADRLETVDGDNPASPGTTVWSASSLSTHDATVVGGVLKHDETDYSTGYLPVGPDLSTGRSGAQYVNFEFQANPLSKFDINVTGTYGGCWVFLPGISDDNSTNNYWDGASADNGWWDMFTAYAGTGVPGTGTGANGSVGCAVAGTMSGTSGSFTCTFGPESAANATSNRIIVRIRLDSGDEITALSFDQASN